MKIAVGALVKFSPSVVRRAERDSRVSGMRGTVLAIHGRIASVDCGDTFISDEGRRIRSIPTANLTAINHQEPTK